MSGKTERIDITVFDSEAKRNVDSKFSHEPPVSFPGITIHDNTKPSPSIHMPQNPCRPMIKNGSQCMRFIKYSSETTIKERTNSLSITRPTPIKLEAPRSGWFNTADNAARPTPNIASPRPNQLYASCFRLNISITRTVEYTMRMPLSVIVRLMGMNTDPAISTDTQTASNKAGTSTATYISRSGFTIPALLCRNK